MTPARGTACRQPVEARRREQAERVPALAPGVADPLVRVEDHEGRPRLRQVVADRQAGLAAADDHGLDPLLGRVAGHLPLCVTGSHSIDAQT